MEVCPLLLDPQRYVADTVDLTSNTKEREYWLPCLERLVKKFVDRASVLNPDKPNATADAENCFRIFQAMIKQLQTNPRLLQPLSVRTLLEFNERTLRNNDFNDAWRLQKEKETTAAFKQFGNRIETIDSITDFNARWVELVKGVLAGNMFDWGAKAVTDLLETSGNFGFIEAMNTIQKRPWFKDDLDNFIDKLKKSPFRKVVIFVDNAGVDFVLGVLPLARELLKQNTEVILSGNSFPALNDITIAELDSCLRQAGQLCPIIQEALDSRRIVGMENGQGGPCLDLKRLNSNLCDKIRDVDLIILEGMGRAVHTNLKADFTVDSVKLAVLKNEWLARSLGAEQFSIIFEYRPAPSLS